MGDVPEGSEGSGSARRAVRSARDGESAIDRGRFDMNEDDTPTGLDEALEGEVIVDSLRVAENRAAARMFGVEFECTTLRGNGGP